MHLSQKGKNCAYPISILYGHPVELMIGFVMMLLNSFGMD